MDLLHAHHRRVDEPRTATSGPVNLHDNFLLARIYNICNGPPKLTLPSAVRRSSAKGRDSFVLSAKINPRRVSAGKFI